jgi:hypothetical protein
MPGWKIGWRVAQHARRLEVLEMAADSTATEIAEIKASVVAYQSDVATYTTNVVGWQTTLIAKVATLEASLAAGGISAADLAALDDLKATAAAPPALPVVPPVPA